MHVVHIDDSSLFLKNLSNSFISSSTHLTQFSSVEAFLEYISAQNLIDLFLIDIDLNSKLTGIDLVKKCRTLYPESVIIMLSSFDSDQQLSKAISNGADEFLTKKASFSEELIFSVYDSCLFARGRARQSKDFPSPKRPLPNFAGATLKKVFNRVEKAMRSSAQSIYIEGESGTGKELVARMIESFTSPGTPFISVNCAEFSESLVESELFGHVKGAFTGAISDKVGLIEQASGGFLFLDEINRLPVFIQQKLLRVLEAKEIRRVGSNSYKKIDFKLVSASNQPASLLLTSGKLELDFWTRISDIEIRLPPIRERTKKEIAEIITFIAKNLPGGPFSVYPLTLKRLLKFNWGNGNVRELSRALKEMTGFHSSKVLLANSIPSYLSNPKESQPGLNPGEALIAFKINLDAPPSLEDLTLFVFHEALKKIKLDLISKGIQPTDQLLSDILKISRPTLAKNIKHKPSNNTISSLEKSPDIFTDPKQKHDVREAVRNFDLFVKLSKSGELPKETDYLNELRCSVNTISEFIERIQ